VEGTLSALHRVFVGASRFGLPLDHMCTTPHDPHRFAVVGTRTHVDDGTPVVRPTTGGKAPCARKGFRFRVAARGRPLAAAASERAGQTGTGCACGCGGNTQAR